MYKGVLEAGSSSSLVLKLQLQWVLQKYIRQKVM